MIDKFFDYSYIGFDSKTHQYPIGRTIYLINSASTVKKYILKNKLRCSNDNFHFTPQISRGNSVHELLGNSTDAKITLQRHILCINYFMVKATTYLPYYDSLSIIQ